MRCTHTLSVGLLGILTTFSQLALSTPARASRSLLRRGLACFQRGELRRAERLLARAAASKLSVRARARALYHLALTRAYRGRTRSARSAFRAALRYDPGVRANGLLVPPRVVALLERERKGLTGTLEIVGGPAGTKARIGDTGRWSLPFEHRVPSAEYAVRVVDPGGNVLFDQRISVRAGSRVRIDVTPPRQPLFRRPVRLADARLVRRRR